MNEYLSVLHTRVNQGRACVLVNVAYTAGSAPREAGTKMVVSQDDVYGSIGGGNLEHNAIQLARALLLNSSASQLTDFLDLYALGPMLEQCCGGVIFLHYEKIDKNNCAWIKVLKELEENSVAAIVVSRTAKAGSESNASGKMIVTEFESFGTIGERDAYATGRARALLEETATVHCCLESLSESKGRLPDISDALLFDIVRPCDFHIVLFGAGHVGKAIVAMLEKVTAASISWVDSRAEIFPALLPAQVTMRHSTMPTNIVQQCPPGCYYLLMTHSHALDLALCAAILTRGDFQFLGLIGSETKKRRFHKRLAEKGFSEKQLERLTCPIGIAGIASKEPGSIAVSVVAQLLQLYEVSRNCHSGPMKDRNIFPGPVSIINTK